MKIKIKNDQIVRESISSSSSSSDSSTENDHFAVKKVEKLVFGEQLQDDVMNSFCDKLQLSCPKRIDGFLAIQFLMCDPESVKKHISGKNEAMQILFDRARSHYILSHYKPSDKLIMLYDSLQLWNNSTGSPIISAELIDYLRCLYSHHFADGVLEIGVDQSYEQQGDDFSCGYRAIGAVVDLARGSNPAGKVYSRGAILEFIQMIMHENHPMWDRFQEARIHRNDVVSTKSTVSIYRILLPPPPPPTSITTSTASSKSVTSVISSVSTATSSRKSAAGEVEEEEEEEEPVEPVPIIELSSPPPQNEQAGFFERTDSGFKALRKVFLNTCFQQEVDDENVEIIQRK